MSLIDDLEKREELQDALDTVLDAMKGLQEHPHSKEMTKLDEISVLFQQLLNL